MAAITVSAVYVLSSLKGAINRGYNPEEILRAQGLPTQLLTNPKLRISLQSFAELIKALAELTRDETFGLLEKSSPIGSSRLIAKACLSSKNIKESLSTWRDCMNWMDNGNSAFTHYEDGNNFIAVTCKKAPGVDDNYVIESMLSSCHRFHCWLSGEFLPLERVDLTYPAPSYAEEHRFVFYGAPVRYDQKYNAIYFSDRILGMNTQRNIDDLDELSKKPYFEILNQTKQAASTYIKVRLWMEKLFRQGNGLPQLQAAAEHLNVSEQTLRRRLRADGFSFNQLKEDTRRDMAIHYIKTSDLSMEEIAFRLCFSEASTFIRAFKNWTGVTPLSYRQL